MLSIGYSVFVVFSFKVDFLTSTLLCSSLLLVSAWLFSPEFAIVLSTGDSVFVVSSFKVVCSVCLCSFDAEFLSVELFNIFA